MQKKSRLLLSILLVVMIFNVVSCKKKDVDVPVIIHPEMEYFNLNNTEIKANTRGFSIDVNHDGRKDLSFHTLLVGDPINQVDKLQFLISTNIQINLPVNSNEEIPVLNHGESIVLSDFGDYHWFELSSIMLVQKITSFTAPPMWEGHWKNAVHKYLPYKVVENSNRYNGWVEISIDIPGEKVVVHQAAISRVPNKIIKAGV